MALRRPDLCLTAPCLTGGAERPHEVCRAARLDGEWRRDGGLWLTCAVSFALTRTALPFLAPLQNMNIGELPSTTLEAIMDSQLQTRGKVCRGGRRLILCLRFIV